MAGQDRSTRMTPVRRGFGHAVLFAKFIKIIEIIQRNRAELHSVKPKFRGLRFLRGDSGKADAFYLRCRQPERVVFSILAHIDSNPSKTCKAGPFALRPRLFTAGRGASLSGADSPRGNLLPQALRPSPYAFALAPSVFLCSTLGRAV